MSATIKRAETLLKRFGFAPGKIDGQTSTNLTTAVKEFQAAWKLPATGELDAKTRSQLEYVAKRQARHPAKDQFVSIGLKSKNIETIERRLRALGYATGKVDGIYDRQTAAAVKAFRVDQPDLKDGGGFLTKGSRAILAKEAAGYAHAPWRSRVKRTAKQITLDNKTAAAAKAGIKPGPKSSLVANVQRHLRAAGFDPQRTTGRFDERTVGALRAFQKRSGLPVTGIVDSKTWSKLRGSMILSTGAASPAQSTGERSAAVKKTESLLKSLGFKTGKVDGRFTAATKNAVRAFEKKYKRKVDGQVSTSDLKKLTTLQKRLGGAEPKHDYRRTSWPRYTNRPPRINMRTKVMLQNAERYLKQLGVNHKFTIVQGSYNKGVTASGGTHDRGGALDISIRRNGRVPSRSVQLKMVKALRMAGFAAWSRGVGNDSFSPHIHAIAIGDRQLSSQARAQVRAFFNGRNGLSGNGRDADRAIGRPIPSWAKKYR